MHETGLVKSLLHEVERTALQYSGPTRNVEVVLVSVKLGALCPFSEWHLHEHFVHEAKGTMAENAELLIERGTDPTDPLAQDVALLSIQVTEVERSDPVSEGLGVAPSPKAPIMAANGALG